eukprot:gnl/TRDRNA2_/TRDRNA2_172584_c1_seq1.p1 gnl/TRDRNA2_/TRDRNA2_172584_c1~~gnl/TRDRNA2_/TRDRNA2_172584_c1_seq1.p1  ORF type:complete len:346 (+),score=21.69 gnl/TRDRNA2_/TRDRNA2_172584_c1_seq1:539-1576(+)
MHVAPLRKHVLGASHFEWRGFGGRSIVSISLCIIWSIFWFSYRVKPDTDIMRGLLAGLCGGNQDFVFGVHAESGLIYAGNSQPFDDNAIATAKTHFYMSAVAEMNSTGDMRSLIKADHSTNNYVLSNRLSLGSIRSIAETWPVCANTGFTDLVLTGFEGFVPGKNFNETLRILTSTGNTANSCSDLASYCQQDEYALVRLLCPVTCGCHMPRSGLFFQNVGGGCPSCCTHVDSYLQAMDSYDCVDPTPAELQTNHPGWGSWWDQFVASKEVWASFPDRRNLTAEARELGCEILKRAHLEQYCHVDVKYGSSLIPFCPGTCGCGSAVLLRQESALCPSTCRSRQPS